MTPEGPRSMGELKKGDMILGWVDGKEEFVRVTSWYHRLPEKTEEYLQLQTENGWMQVSAKHNLASRSKQYEFAEEVESLFPEGHV